MNYEDMTVDEEILDRAYKLGTDEAIKRLSTLHCSPLFLNQIANHRDPLMRKVWGGTPWMIDVVTGNIDSDRYQEMRDWCNVQFGRESWPLHGRFGNWQFGGATVMGSTWIGFATEEMMKRFEERWGKLPTST